jgi:hypothetical protein
MTIKNKLTVDEFGVGSANASVGSDDFHDVRRHPELLLHRR